MNHGGSGPGRSIVKLGGAHRRRRWLATLFALACLTALLPAAAEAAECTNTWAGGTEGVWQTGANWSAGHVPKSTEVACIGSGKTVKVTGGTNQTGIVQGEGSLDIQESTLEILNVLEPSNIGSLTLKYGAVLTGPGTVDVSNTFAWTSESTMSGSGTTVLGPEASSSITTGGGWATLDKRNLVNEGVFAINGGVLMMSEGAVLDNEGTLTINHEEGVFDVHDIGGSTRPEIVNAGLLQKTAGTGETDIEVNIENFGEIDASTGTFGFTRKGGTGLLASGSTLKGSFNLQGPTFFTESFDGHAATVVMREASLSAIAGQAGTIGSLEMDYKGDLTGPGTVEITKSLSWVSESTMSGSGATVLLPSATGTITTYWGELAERTLVNEGTFDLVGEGTVRESNGATLRNEGTLGANATESYARSPGILTETSPTPPLLVNDGTIQKTVGTGNTRLNVNVENNGLIDAETGTLLFNRPGASAVLASGSTLEGASVFEQTAIEGDGFDASNGSLTARESAITLEGENTTIANLKIEYGTVLGGSGDLEVTQSFDWYGESTVGGSGNVLLGPSTHNTLNSGATTVTLSHRKLVNEGIFTQTSYSRLKEAAGATIKNVGTYDLNSEPYPTWIRNSIQFEAGPAPSRFVNTGLFQRTEGSIPLEVTPAFENRGALKESSSKIEIPNPVTRDNSEQFGQHCHSADPVDCATGNFSESQTDLAIGGLGIGLELSRVYNAQAAASALSPGAFGYGWSGPLSDHLIIEEGGAAITVVRADGSTVPFVETGAGSFEAPPWSPSTLSGDTEGGYTFILPGGIEYDFSGGGQLEDVSERNGNETTLSYDEVGRLSAITDPTGRSITYTYNGAGRVEQAEDPMGHVVQYSYEGANLASVKMPGETGVRWSFKYDGSHRMTSMTDGRGGKTTNEYDGANRVVSQTDPAKRTITFEYAPFHTKITNTATGSVTDEWFTSDNEPYSVTHGYGTPEATTETYSYNAIGQQTSISDGNGHKTIYGYDAHGNRTSEKDADGDTKKWTYDEAHQLTSLTTAGGETTMIERDGNGNIESISRPGPGATVQTSTFAYDEHGQLESLTDPLEQTWTYGYDPQGDRTSETNPVGDTVTEGYDEDSRPTSMVSPRGNVEGAKAAEYTTTIERDPQGRPEAMIDPLGHVTEYAYDPDGNLETKTDANSKTASYTYNPDNERTKVEQPDGAVLETDYDGAGNVISQTDANEGTTTYIRNALGEPVEVIDPLGRTTSEEFDGAGNLIASIDPAERETSYYYDPANRLMKVGYSDGTTPTVEYEYDPDANLIGMVDGSGESTFEYDRLGRLTRSQNGHGDVVGYEYDLGDELIGITYPNGKAITREFDPAGRLESVSDWLGGQTSFAYDPDSNLEGIAFPAASGNLDEYTFDRDDRMSGATFSKGAETLGSLSYTREALGQIEEEANEGLPGAKTVGYGYDENDRLVGAGAATYEYDSANALIKAPGTANKYDAAGQLESGTGVSYTFDKLGERIKTTPGGSPATSYEYDQAGHLTVVTRPGEGEVEALNEGFSYDGRGSLSAITSGLSTRFLSWDGSGTMPLLLTDGQNSYLYGPNGMPIEQISSGESATYLHHDQLGSTRLLTDGEGKATGTFTYGPYGNLAGRTGEGATPLGFAGQYTSQPTGLQYLRARFYDPATGQFLTRDPLEALTHAPYAYAEDNPVTNTDPGGLGPCILGFIDCDESDDPCDSIASGPMLGLCLLPPSAEQPVANAAAGFGDGSSLGLTNAIREAMGTNGAVDKCSGWYLAGQAGGTLLDLGILATPEVTGAAGYWSDEFASRYPQVTRFLVEHGSHLNDAKDAARFYAEWIARHLGG